jgi:cadmium resistance protein CadD (predicted permease)
MDTRIGQFFFLVGLLVMFVFFASYMSETPKYNLFLIGLGSIFLGVFIMVRSRKPSGESERFRHIRKLRKKK